MSQLELGGSRGLNEAGAAGSCCGHTPWDLGQRLSAARVLVAWRVMACHGVAWPGARGEFRGCVSPAAWPGSPGLTEPGAPGV